jgi:hypothetical protein
MKFTRRRFMSRDQKPGRANIVGGGASRGLVRPNTALANVQTEVTQPGAALAGKAVAPLRVAPAQAGPSGMVLAILFLLASLAAGLVVALLPWLR